MSRSENIQQRKRIERIVERIFKDASFSAAIGGAPGEFIVCAADAIYRAGRRNHENYRRVETGMPFDFELRMDQDSPVLGFYRTMINAVLKKYYGNDTHALSIVGNEDGWGTNRRTSALVQCTSKRGILDGGKPSPMTEEKFARMIWDADMKSRVCDVAVKQGLTEDWQIENLMWELAQPFGHSKGQTDLFMARHILKNAQRGKLDPAFRDYMRDALGAEAAKLVFSGRLPIGVIAVQTPAVARGLAPGVTHAAAVEQSRRDSGQGKGA